ncbi:MAG: hypothetical protein LBF69_00855 [Prevotellaceae bacterium]|jgi:hypothetical protein|nr:hypothetical protein [Prevotellaceae bacterium]
MDINDIYAMQEAQVLSQHSLSAAKKTAALVNTLQLDSVIADEQKIVVVGFSLLLIVAFVIIYSIKIKKKA